jgi:hypothetical protein
VPLGRGEAAGAAGGVAVAGVIFGRVAVAGVGLGGQRGQNGTRHDVCGCDGDGVGRWGWRWMEMEIYKYEIYIKQASS